MKVEKLYKITCEMCGTQNNVWAVIKKNCKTFSGERDIDTFMCQRCALKINKEVIEKDQDSRGTPPDAA